MLASAASYYIKLWDLNNENDIVSVKEKSSCMPHGSSNVLCMEWTQDLSLIGSAGSDGCLVLCMPETGIFSEVIPTGTLKNSKNDEIHSMKFYDKSNFIVFGGSGKIIKCWDRKHNKFINNYTGHTSTIYSMDINHSENNICSVSESGDLLINSIETKDSILRNISKNPLNKIIYSKTSNSTVFTIDDHGLLYSYDTINLATIDEISISNSSINDITVSPLNKDIVVTANEEGTITFIDTQNKNIVNTYKVNDSLTALSIRVDGSMLACGTSRGQVLLYDIRMNKQLHKYWAETKSIQSLKFQKSSSSNINNRKRSQSILTLENNTIYSKKHMLSSENVELEDLNNKTGNSIINHSSLADISTPAPSVTKITSTISNDNSSSNSDNITTDILTAFSSSKKASQSNIFPSNINPPFDYNFSKNKFAKYTNTISNDDNKSKDNDNNDNDSNRNTNTTLTNTNNKTSVMTFTEFLKSKSNTNTSNTNTNTNINLDNSNNNTVDTNHNSSPIPKKNDDTILNDNQTSINNNVSKEKKENKQKSNNDDDMNIDGSTTYNDIWLNPEIFSNPNDDQDVSVMAESSKPTLNNTGMTSTSNPNEENSDSTTKSGLTLPDQIKSGNAMDESMVDHYLDENTNLLKEKLQKNIRNELEKKGVSIANDNNETDNNKLDEGMTTISNKILESVVNEGLQELKSFLRNDIKNMHLEIIGQFHFQKYEIEKMFKDQQEKIGPLLNELQKLREENERLKCRIYRT